MTRALANFLDRDPNIKAARTSAYKYMKNVMLSDYAVGDQKISPRSLAATIEQELIDKKIEFNLPEHAEPYLKPNEYDPEKEKADEVRAAEKANELKKSERFEQIVDALSKMSDPQIRALSPEEINDIKIALAGAESFIVQQMLPEASENVVSARENLEHSGDIAKKVISITAKKSVSNIAPDDMICDRNEIAHAAAFLKFVYQRASTIELAIGDLLGAVSEVNKAMNQSKAR